MKLPRPRYGLRTLFIAITAFAIWLGWQGHIVRELKALIQLIRDQHGWITLDGMSGQENEMPWYRRLLGDHSVVWIQCDPGLTNDEWFQIRSRFQEAVVTETGLGW